MEYPTKKSQFIIFNIPTDLSKPIIKPIKSRIEPINDERYPNPSSHVALMPVLVLGQVFAAIPVCGVTSKKATDLNFKWFDLRTLHTILVLIGIFIMIVVYFKWTVAKITLTEAPGLDIALFYVYSFVGLSYFLWLAQKWPALMVYWEKIEKTLPSYFDRKQNANFSKAINIMTFVIIICSFFELSGRIAIDVIRARECSNSTEVKYFFLMSMSQVYSDDNYDGGVRGYLIEYLNCYCSIQANYMDIFAIVISFCLANRFKQLNLHLEHHKGKKVSNGFWIEQRHHFTNMIELVARVDQLLTMMCSFSLVLNLYTILIQLLSCFKPQRTVFEAIFFWYYLLSTIVRKFLVFWAASQINDESQKPANVLRYIPNDAYDSEAYRFLEQVVNTKVGLTGLRLLYFTRSLMLSIVGTIITYELVLVQFQMTIPHVIPDFCNNIKTASPN